MKLDIDKLDFDHCEDEQIHIPEAIQGYGYLFALDPKTYTVKIHSKNTNNLFEKTSDLIGKNFLDFLNSDKMDMEFLKDTYKRSKEKDIRLPIRLRFKKELLKDKDTEDYYSVVYPSGQFFTIELEPEGKFRQTYSVRHHMKIYALSIAPKFKAFQSLDNIANEIVNTIRYITEMERVVLYRFNRDGSGKVIAESKVDDIDSYLDVHHPQSDIPAQARELYKKNWIRLIPDVDLEPSPLVPSVQDQGREPLDLTKSILRNLSPIHRQYVKNQGLKASMSMSLVTYDELWGMISCHDRQPKYIPQNVRLECENLSQLFSWHLYAKEEEIYIEKRKQVDQKIEVLLEKKTQEESIVNVFENNTEEVLSIVQSDGFIFFTNNETISIGNTPLIDTINEVIDTIDLGENKVFSTNSLQKDFPKQDWNKSCGMLLIPLLEEKNYYTAWFRKEQVMGLETNST
jgi:light-regulated signal transduction histidine kinase (bacteriophytochrome)